MLFDTTLSGNAALSVDKIRAFFKANPLSKFRKIRLAVTNSQSHHRHLQRNLARTPWACQDDHLVICYGLSGAGMEDMAGLPP